MSLSTRHHHHRFNVCFPILPQAAGLIVQVNDSNVSFGAQLYNLVPFLASTIELKWTFKHELHSALQDGRSPQSNTYPPWHAKLP